jgi:O-antigen/teichoic acid export membrane protein
MGAASRITTTAAGAITTIILARALEPEGWASYFVAQSLIVILVAFTTLGIEQGIAYYVSSARWDPGAAFASALKVALCMGVLGAAAGVCARLLFPSAFAALSVWLTVIVLIALPFTLAMVYTTYIALAIDRYEVAMSLPATLAVLVLALAVPAGIVFGLQGAIVGTTIAAVAVGVGSVIWGKQLLRRPTRSQPGQLRRAISFGTKGYAANALQLVSYRLDLFVLSAVASSAVLGSYSLAVALTSLLWLLPRAVSDVLFPRIARLTGDDDVARREIVETKSVRHVSLVTMVSAVLFVPGVELLLVPIFGEEYRPAVNLGLILLPGAAAIGLSAVLMATVVGRGKPMYSLYGALAITPLTVLLYVTLIPWLDADGAAIGSTISYLCSFALALWLYRRVTGRRLSPALIPTRSEIADLVALTRSMTSRTAAKER